MHGCSFCDYGIIRDCPFCSPIRLLQEGRRQAFKDAAKMVRDALDEWLDNNVEGVPAFALPLIAKLQARAKGE